MNNPCAPPITAGRYRQGKMRPMTNPYIDFTPERRLNGPIATPEGLEPTCYGTLTATYSTHGENILLEDATAALQAAAEELGITLGAEVRPTGDSFVGRRRTLTFGSPAKMR